MSDTVKIPDNVWENRCRYCIHGNINGLQEIPKSWIWKNYHDQDRPCKIIGVSHPDESTGECSSFAPNHIYGICATCKHDNIFHEGYCMMPEQPNRRQIYTGQGYSKPSYWAVHRLSTCDNYTPDPDWKDIMIREAAEGKIPRNFDPETMEKTEDLNPTKWAVYEQEILEEKEQQNKAKIIKDAERRNQVPGQQMMNI